MKADISDAMVEQQLDARAAQEKLNIDQDPVYHLLADIIEVLDTAYKEAGVNRPIAQVRAEATDTMLQMVSEESGEPSREFMADQIRGHVRRYHDLPSDFNDILDEAFRSRGEKKKTMSPEDLSRDVFRAYLGSMGLTEDEWRKERKDQAKINVYHDLLLDAVAKAENLKVGSAELNEVLQDIAQQCDMEFEEIAASIDTRPVKDQILRDKARKLILESAVPVPH